MPWELFEPWKGRREDGERQPKRRLWQPKLEMDESEVLDCRWRDEYQECNIEMLKNQLALREPKRDMCQQFHKRLDKAHTELYDGLQTATQAFSRLVEVERELRGLANQFQDVTHHVRADARFEVQTFHDERRRRPCVRSVSPQRGESQFKEEEFDEDASDQRSADQGDHRSDRRSATSAEIAAAAKLSRRSARTAEKTKT